MRSLGRTAPMFAMQLTISLEQGRDGPSVHRRVEECAHGAQQQRDLVHVSYLINPNEFVYAPFYVWRSEEAMCGFLLGKPFTRVVRRFGRPRLRTWNILQFHQAAAGGTATFAAREIDAICSQDSLEAAARREDERHRGLLDLPGLRMYAVMLNPGRWEIARFSLWCDEPAAGALDADCVETYQIGDFSEPIAA